MKQSKQRKAAGPSLQNASAHSSGNEPFYERPEEVPLTTSGLARGAPRGKMKTSLHAPGRAHAESNRAARWAIIRLLLIWLLVITLPILGFLGLWRILERMDEPTAREQVRWERDAEKMQHPHASDDDASEPTPATPVVAGKLLGPETMERHIERWTLAERHLRAAEGLARRGIDDQALERLQIALQINPRLLGALRLLEEVALRTQNDELAITAGVRLLDVDPRSWATQIRLLGALRRSGQVDAGIILARQMLTTQPNDIEVLDTLAIFELQQGNLPEAESLFQRILRLNSHHLPSLHGMAAITSARQEWPEAATYYERLLHLDPDEADAIYALALCRAYLEQTDEAVELLNRAMSLFGNAKPARWIRNPGFDPIREEPLFRSLADRLVGTEARQAFEDLRRHHEEEQELHLPERFELPRIPDFRIQSR